MTATLIDAADFGVPQSRQRIVFLGVRPDVSDPVPSLVGTGVTNAVSLERIGKTRVLLGDIPGFNPQGEEEKQKRVDLVFLTKERRILVTAKWSIRADREEQFGTDFDAYVRATAGRPFEHVLVKNEFDAARLKHACNAVAANARLFQTVVHVNPDGALLRAYGIPLRHSAAELPELLSSGRLVALSSWLSSALAL